MLELKKHPSTSSAADWLVGGGEMAKLIKAKDWSTTALGPITTWPQSLRTVVSLAQASNSPISLIWGPGHVQIYNDGYWPICAAKHPTAMGQDFRECWATAWPVIGEAYAAALAGKPSYLEKMRIFLDRYGFMEETWFTFSFSPITDESGKVGGLFHPVTEMTSQMLSERRSRILRDLAICTGTAKTTADVFVLATQILAESDLDIPFVAFYLVDAEIGRAHFAAQCGLPPGRSICPEEVNLALPVTSPWPIAEVVLSGSARPIPDLAQCLSGLHIGPYEENATQGLALPIAQPGSARPAAVMLAGVSSRLILDESYRSFYDGVVAAISASLANARAYEAANMKALAEIDRAKATFYSNVSHEFRTPLTLMLGPLEDELGERELPLPTERRERLQTAHRNALRLLKLVNSLLDFSRIEAGRSEQLCVPTDLAALTAGIASGFRSAMERGGLTFEVDCAPLPEPVYVDREMWEKIVLNLLSNAFKHTLHGSVTVTLSWQVDRVMLSIVDTGVGIAEAELPKLFQRFHRVQGAVSRTRESTGIGLSLVRELVAQHGGEIRAESEEGVGSRFTVSIPTGKAHLPPERLGVAGGEGYSSCSEAYVEDALQWLAPEAGCEQDARNDTAGEGGSDTHLTHAESATRPRIIWADDDVDMREYVARLLADEFDVQSVAHGAEALAAAQAAPPDLVLSDVMMPQLDGFGLLRALRADQRTESVPVVLLSARAGEEESVAGLQAGADDYLVKPFSAKELRARVRAAITRSHMRRESAQREDLQRQVEERTQELRDSEEAALRALTQLNATLAAIPDILLELDLDGKYHAYHSGKADLRAPPVSELIGKTVSEVLPADAAVTILAALQEANETGVSRGRQIELPVTSGSCWFELSAARKPVESGIPPRFIVISRDITERKQAEMAHASLESQLRESQKMQAVGTLAGGIAHDFNNILTTILGNTELARQDLGDNTCALESLEQIRKAGARARDLVQQMLSFSRRQPTERKLIELCPVVEETVRLLRATMPARLTLSVHCDVDVPPVLADVTQIQQVVINLLTNAMQAATAGPGKIALRLDAVTLDAAMVVAQPALRALHEKHPGETVRLTVSDNGRGMDADTLGRIFEPFFTTKAVDEGAGLGLSVVHGIVRTHEGAIAVVSTPGMGASFTVYLPAAARQLPPPTLPQNFTTDATSPRVISSRHILYIDDDESLVFLVTRLLERRGCKISGYVDSRQALAALRANPASFDIVITDYNMPGLSGLDVAREVRTIRSDLPVAIATGFMDEKLRANAESVGVKEVVLKANDPEDLCDAFIRLARNEAPH